MAMSDEYKGFLHKNRDVDLLINFLSSQLDPTTKEKNLAKLRFEAVKKMGNAYLTLPTDVSVWSLWRYFGPGNINNPEPLIDVMKINNNILQTYHIAKMVPNKYYDHPLVKMAKMARFDTGEFEMKFQKLMLTLGMDQLLDAYRDLEYSLAQFEHRADQKRRKKSKLEINPEELHRLKIKMLFGDATISKICEKKIKGEDDKYLKNSYIPGLMTVLTLATSAGLSYYLCSSILGASIDGAGVVSTVKSALGFFTFLQNFFPNDFNLNGIFNSTTSSSTDPSGPEASTTSSSTTTSTPDVQNIEWESWLTEKLKFGKPPAALAGTAAGALGGAMAVKIIFPRWYEETLKNFCTVYNEKMGYNIESQQMAEQVKKASTNKESPYSQICRIIVKINILKTLLATYR